MSHVFDMSRFLRLVRSHFQKNLKAYLISCLVFAGVTVLLFTLTTLTQQRSVGASGQFFVYVVVIYGGVFVFTANVFQTFQRPREGMFQLMLPASGFEKFMLGWLVSFVGYTVCANVLFFAVRYAVLQYYLGRGYEVSGFLDFDDRLYQGIPMVPVLVMVYVFIHAFALYGSLVFRKMAVLKTALALFLATVAYRSINGVLFSALFLPDIQQQASLLPLTPASLQKGGVFYRIDIPDWPYWLAAVAIAVVGLLWVASYHKLREKEA